MRIPFPERIPLLYAILFAFLLLVGLLLNGTGSLFAAMVFVFAIVATVAFNIAGGFTRPTGAYVFFFAVLVALLGLVIKVIVWEPAELLLHSPLTTMAAYTGAMCSMLAAVYISRKLSRKHGLLQDICSTEDMKLAAIGCTVGGIVIPILAAMVEASGNELLLPIAVASRQFNRFLQMAIILGTTYEINSSGGKRSYNLPVIIAAIYTLYDGLLLNFSKEALFTPPLCWLISGAALRYRFSLVQVGGVLVTFMLFSYYLVPYSQYGRTFKDPLATYSQKVETSISLLGNLGDVREKYLEEERGIVRAEDGTWFFKNSMGLFDRLTMFGIDDALNTVTDEKGEYGMSPYFFYVVSVIPRVLWKNKPSIGYGNVFAHEIGFNPEDTTTGISFSPVAESYHEAKWFGVLLVEPLVWIVMFTVMDSLCGDTRKSPWGILVVAMYAHVAPESGIEGLFYAMTYGALVVCIVAFFAAYVMPLLASFITPPKKKVIQAPPVRQAAFLNGRPEPAEQ